LEKKMSEDFYRAFEAKFRGSREVINQRLKVYVPFLEPLQSLYPHGEALDLGCGRGEWLGLMDGLGFNAVGVDLNQAMLNSCLEFGLKGLQGDALEYLANLPDGSQVVISAFHLIEHISFDQLQELVRQSLRVLKPGGLLILETPNSENIRVATQSFYLDPTHLKPIPSLQLSFLTEYVGFKKNKVIRLQEEMFAGQSTDPLLRKVINGVSQDYAVIAQKEISQDIYGLKDNPFAQSYGVSIDEVVHQYDSDIHYKNAVMENEFKHLHNEFKHLHNEFIALYSSRSWRMTRPMRLAGEEIRLWKTAFRERMQIAKLKIKFWASRSINWIKRHPRFYEPLKKMMQALGIFNLLKKIAGRKGISMDLYVSTRPEPWVPSAHLSDQALKMATELKSHVHKSKK
jgi:O-antigen chain-terminating methyltransferase